MAKERPPGPKAKRDASKYFPDQLAMQTNLVVKRRFEVALAKLNAGSDLRMLDQDKITIQTCANMLILWLSRTIESEGVTWINEEMGPVMDELSAIVAEEMMSRGRFVSPRYLPEGFSYIVRRTYDEQE